MITACNGIVSVHGTREDVIADVTTILIALIN